MYFNDSILCKIILISSSPLKNFYEAEWKVNSGWRIHLVYICTFYPTLNSLFSREFEIFTFLESIVGMKSWELRKLKCCKVENDAVFAGQTEDVNPVASW